MIQGFIIITLLALIALLVAADWLHSHHAPKPTCDDDDDEVDA